jgi:hypothetical protein
VPRVHVAREFRLSLYCNGPSAWAGPLSSVMADRTGWSSFASARDFDVCLERVAHGGTVRDESLVLEARAGRGYLMDVAFSGGRSPYREVDFVCEVPGVTGFGGFVTKGSVGLRHTEPPPTEWEPARAASPDPYR